MKKVLSLTFLSLMLINGVMAQTQTYNFSLQEAIEYAYTNQSAMKNANLDVEIAKNKVKETVAMGLPQVNGVVTFQNFIDIPTQLVPANFFDTSAPPGTYAPLQFGTKYNLSYGVEGSMLLFDGTYLVGVQAASTYKELSQKSLQRTSIETSVAVTKAYYYVLVGEENLKMVDANLVRLKKSFDDTKALNQSGFAEKIDADRLEVLYNNAVTQKANFERLYQMSIQLLKFQIGMPVTDNLTLKDKLIDVQIQQVTLEEAAANPESRIEYSLLQTQRRLNQLDYKRYIINRAPTLALFGSYTENAQNDDLDNLTDLHFPTTIVGLKLTVPLIGSGQKTFQGRQAKLSLMKTENDLQNLENFIALESRQTQVNYTNSITSLDNQKKNMELAQRVLDVSKTKYDQGVGSSLEVTTAETALKEAQTNYITALYDALVAKVELDKAYGRIK
jgi:outer membrane protein